MPPSLMAAQLTAGGRRCGHSSTAQHRPGPVTRFPRLVPATTIHYTLYTLHYTHTTPLHWHWGWAATILVIQWFPPATLYIGKLKTVLLLLFIGKSGKIEKTCGAGLLLCNCISSGFRLITLKQLEGERTICDQFPIEPLQMHFPFR